MAEKSGDLYFQLSTLADISQKYLALHDENRTRHALKKLRDLYAATGDVNRFNEVQRQIVALRP